MQDAVEPIKQYVLAPDGMGSHLRQMAEQMARGDLAETRTGFAVRPHVYQSLLDRAAETIARFIHLVWAGSGPKEYAPRTFEMLRALQDRVRGMDPDSTWDYAIGALNMDIRSRLKRASAMTLDPDMESALVHQFFDSLDTHDYLHDVARNIMHFHWERRHSPDAATVEERTAGTVLAAARGDPVLEKHLERTAIESLATYIEQSNIARGNLERPTDPRIVLRDRIETQFRMGGKSAETWEASGRQLADHIERRFGTRAGRREARIARGGWKALSRKAVGR